MEEAQSPRSFMLQAKNGKTYCRNVKMINKSQDKSVIVPETIDDQPLDKSVPPAAVIPEGQNNTEPDIRLNSRSECTRYPG